MIPRVIWPHRSFESSSPFSSLSKQRPLRLTIHRGEDISYSLQELEAIDLIYELSAEPEIDVLDFLGQKAPKIEYIDEASMGTHHGLKVSRPSGEEISRNIGIPKCNLTDSIVQLRYGIQVSSDPNLQMARNHHKAFEAHISLDRDIFVTNSKFIIQSRQNPEIGNPRTPHEATRIVGLCLRTHGNWTYIKSPRVTITSDLGMVYWKVVRARLPSMWRYFSILLRTDERYGQDLGRIGQTILERASRALQARDEIARQFYLHQSNNTRDLMMYHFDYLTLLLSGIYDSLAIVANRVYDLFPRNKEFLVGFRRAKFRNRLESSNGNNLHNLLMSARTQQLETLLHELRNTIHSAGLGTYAYLEPGSHQESYARLPESIRDEIWNASRIISSPDDWGIIRDEFNQLDEVTGKLLPRYDIAIDPCSYADALTRYWLPLINEIAHQTAVEIAYRGDQSDILDAMPEDWLEDVRRFELLVG